MTFAEPGMLLLALLIPIALWIRRQRGEPALRFAPAPLAVGLPRTWRVRLLPLPRLLGVAALLLGIVALARPVRRDALPREREAIDVLLCVDRSSSMAARDLDPGRSRLEVAKRAAADFIRGRPDDRLGLVAFARYPDLLCPPTRDHAALAAILAGVEQVEADGPEDATGFGSAVARAAQLLQKSAARSKVVILLTDGEENVATADHPDEIAPLHAAQLCREYGVRAYTILAGVGAPDRAGGFAPLDTRQVAKLAETTGGAFFQARDADAVARVYEQIDALERTALLEPRFAQTERFLPFLIGALACLVAGRLLRATWLEVLP